MSELAVKGARLQKNQQNSGKPALQPGEIALAFGVSPERWQQAQLALKASEVNNMNGQLQYSSGFDRVNEDPQLDWLRSPGQQVLLKGHFIDGVALKTLAETMVISPCRIKRALQDAIQELHRMVQQSGEVSIKG